MARYVIGLKNFKNLKAKLNLSTIQQDFLIGSILGDGCLQLSKRGDSARLQIRNSSKYSEYVKWKYRIVDKWSPRGLILDKCNNSMYFDTVFHPKLFEWHQKFYQHKRKIIPQNISEILINPLSLAIWLMDDGNGYLRSKALRISSYSFDKDEHELLQKCLKDNFQLETSIFCDSKGYQLYIKAKSAAEVYKLIQTHICPVMDYKFARLNPVETTRQRPR